jgi:hypothetical protein
VTVSLASLQKLMSLNLSTEQMAGVMEVLTVELAPKRSGAAERQARYRARKKGVTRDVTNNVTRDVTETSPVTSRPSRVEDNIINISLVETSRNKKPIPPSPLSSKPLPDGFEQFWAIYPKRDGAMDRKGSAKAFTAALRRVSLTTILDGAEHFAQAMTARGKVGTEYIPLPRTWLNGDRWNDRYDTGPADDDKQAHNLAILEKYAAPSGS